MRTETLHLTLAFLGRVEANRLDELRIMGAAIDRPAFDFSLDRFGHWHHNRIVWAGCRATPEPLQDLATELRRCLDRAGIAYAAGVFVPHVTLLRDAHCPIQPVQPAPLAWTAREFRLVASEPGIRYRELACWSFR